MESKEYQKPHVCMCVCADDHVFQFLITLAVGLSLHLSELVAIEMGFSTNPVVKKSHHSTDTDNKNDLV